MIGAILGSYCSVVSWTGLVLDEGRQTDDASPDAIHRCLDVTKGSGRPVTPALREWRVGGANVIAHEEGELESDTLAFVAGVAVFSQVGGMDPPLHLEQHPYAIQVSMPNGDIDVRVIPCHTAGVEVHRPTPEKPVVDVLVREEPVQPGNRLQLPGGGPDISRHGTHHCGTTAEQIVDRRAVLR
jgi:hypothetical protein